MAARKPVNIDQLLPLVYWYRVGTRAGRERYRHTVCERSGRPSPGGKSPIENQQTVGRVAASPGFPITTAIQHALQKIGTFVRRGPPGWKGWKRHGKAGNYQFLLTPTYG